MKKISFKGISEVLSQKELRNCPGGWTDWTAYDDGCRFY